MKLPIQILPIILFVEMLYSCSDKKLVIDSSFVALAEQGEAEKKSIEQTETTEGQISLTGKWNITRIETQDGWQTLQYNNSEKPYLWLKKDGEAELYFFFGKQPGKWEYNVEDNTLLITDPDTTTRFEIERHTSESLTLRSKNQTGDMDIIALVAQKEK